jgi:hypothetical protein
MQKIYSLRVFRKNTIVHSEASRKISGMSVEKRCPKLQYTASHSIEATIISEVEKTSISPESFSSGVMERSSAVSKSKSFIAVMRPGKLS